MTGDPVSVSERDPCLGSGKVTRGKNVARRPHQLVIDAPAHRFAAKDKTPKVNSAPQSLHHTGLSAAVHLLLSITSWGFIRIGYPFDPC